LEGKRIDEEEMMDGGLRGRFSAGGEVYFSAKQRSFGSKPIAGFFDASC
jgi:distribution and morphology protein 10